MTIREMREKLGVTQSEFAERYHIPFRTVQNWEAGVRTPPDYVFDLLNSQIQKDLVNRRTIQLPMYDAKKKNLPKRSSYIGAIPWLQAVQKCLGNSVVFALDEALMCQENFGGRSDEFLIWIYGDDAATEYNGVVVLGNRVNPFYVQEKDGIRFTDFGRTLSDALANESILDMQGITEALSRYYFQNGDSFSGISVAPEYQDRFAQLAADAAGYYE